jgi:GT2 family glycosyltransferase
LTAIVVDGGSGDDSATELAAAIDTPDYRDWVSFLPLAVNGGFGWANNQAILTLARRSEPPEFIHLLNPDTEVREGAIANLVEELRQHPRCGAAGSQLISLDGAKAASAFRFPSSGREFVGGARSEVLGRLFGIGSTVVSTLTSTEVDWVTGASVMFRARALQESGLFDDGFFLYFEEVELMHRLHEKGWTVRHVPSSRVSHVEGASTGLGAGSGVRSLPGYWYESRQRFFARVGGPRAVLAANISSIAGHAVSALKRFGGSRTAMGPASVRGIVRCGLLARRKDLSASVAQWGDAPGRPPAWMSAG